MDYHSKNFGIVRSKTLKSKRRSVCSSTTSTECLIDQRFANEDRAIIIIMFEPEKFSKCLFQSVRPFLGYISDHVGPIAGAVNGLLWGREVKLFQVTINQS